MKRTRWLQDLLDNIPPVLTKNRNGESQDQDFDPNLHDLGEVIQQINDFALNFPEHKDWGYAFDWIYGTLGINFSDLQARWKDIPHIIVPDHIERQPELLVRLDQIKLAYMVGANLAAIALCRSTTELLIRNHYANHIPNAHITSGKGRRTLTGSNPLGLIDEAQNRYEFLRKFNLGSKVDEANKILHQPGTGELGSYTFLVETLHQNPYRGLVITWMNDLEEMIDRAPPSKI